MTAPATMIGLKMPDLAEWSSRVMVALGQNPSMFTGPGTNTYLVGTGKDRILLDTGSGLEAYLPVFAQALEESGCGIQEIVLTHGHPDHIGGCLDVIGALGPRKVSKFPWPLFDDRYELEINPIGDGAVIETEGATLRALHTPGHAADHLCFVLEEESSIFTGDNVLGVGTTVIPSEGGDLLDYMNSLDRLLEEEPSCLYPAHGPRIEDGPAKIREYIAHRLRREEQIVDAIAQGDTEIAEIVARVYAAYPKELHLPARASVCSHLLKLERENRVVRAGDDALSANWTLA